MTTGLMSRQHTAEPGPTSLFPNCTGAGVTAVLSLTVDGGYVEYAVGDTVTEGEIQILVDGGTEEFVVGDVVTDDGVGAGSGTIDAIILKSGVWTVGGASGTAILILSSVTGTFTNDAGITGATAGIAVGNGTGTAAGSGVGTVAQVNSSSGVWDSVTHSGTAVLVLTGVTGTFTNNIYLAGSTSGGAALNDGTGTAGSLGNDPTSVNGKGIASILASDVVGEVGKYTITLTDMWAGLLSVRFCYLDGDTTDDWEMTVLSETVATTKKVVVQVFKSGTASASATDEKLFFELVLSPSKVLPLGY